MGRFGGMDTDNAIRAVVAFPLLDADDRQWIESIRANHVGGEGMRYIHPLFPAVSRSAKTESHLTSVGTHRAIRLACGGRRRAGAVGPGGMYSLLRRTAPTHWRTQNGSPGVPGASKGPRPLRRQSRSRRYGEGPASPPRRGVMQGDSPSGDRFPKFRWSLSAGRDRAVTTFRSARLCERARIAKVSYFNDKGQNRPAPNRARIARARRLRDCGSTCLNKHGTSARRLGAAFSRRSKSSDISATPLRAV